MEVSTSFLRLQCAAVFLGAMTLRVTKSNLSESALVDRREKEASASDFAHFSQVGRPKAKHMRNI
eukprot:1988759-Rhodomonas_salina.1